MMGILQSLFYVSLFAFVVGVGLRALRIARMPLHLRWDLYPIPHEKGKSHYGGSYFEELDWWTHPANTSRWAEMKEMAKEIFFIQSMYHNNRSLWAFSFPFHAGLYLLVGFVLLVFGGGALTLAGIPVIPGSSSTVVRLVFSLTIFLGVGGSAIALLGAAGLLVSRFVKRELRMTSVWTDYANLLLLLGVFISAIFMWATVDPGFDLTRGFASGIISFRPVTELPPAAGAHYFLAAVFLLWLPFTHMTHFVGKYFTYHKVRWEDTPNLKASPLESAVKEALGYRIIWSAPHIKSNGSWAEAATDVSKTQEKKQ
jgi:nitrate reductase gamma subunit